MTLRGRLALSLVIIAAVLVVPLLVARQSLAHLHGEIKKLRDDDFHASLVLGRLRDAIAEARGREIALSVVKSDEVHTQLAMALTLAIARADTLDRYHLDSSAAVIKSALGSVLALADQEYAALRAGKPERADTISTRDVGPAMRAADRAIIPLERALRDRTAERVSGAAVSLEDGQRMMFAALAVALLLATAIALWLTRSISEPVFALEEGMRAVADGDLDHKLGFDVTRHDEFGRLATSFQDMSLQLAELDKLKAEFVSIASHELKTPINVIIGYLQLMQEGIYGPLTEKQLPVTETIVAQARTLARLAGQLLDVSRFEAGGGRIDPRPIKLFDMLDELERTFHVLAVQRQVTLLVTRMDGLPPDVVWDTDRINEVTGNLLSNAFKFTPAGGTVELTAGPSGNGICIEIRDTGAGIAPSQLPHVFEKFYQADNQRSASAKGSGLGLAIAKEIVEAHRGTIKCSSVVGGGTTFTLILPITAGKLRRTSGFKMVKDTGRAS